MIRIKRVYEAPEDADGYRVLVDRLWPRGVSKEAAALDRWMREIAPSDELRDWFNHDPAKWHEFRRRYEGELQARDEEIAELRERGEVGTLTLVYAAKDDQHNNAVALRDYLIQSGRGE